MALCIPSAKSKVAVISFPGVALLLSNRTWVVPRGLWPERDSGRGGDFTSHLKRDNKKIKKHAFTLNVTFLLKQGFEIYI